MPSNPVGIAMPLTEEEKVKAVAEVLRQQARVLAPPRQYTRHKRVTLLPTPEDWRTALSRLNNLAQDLNLAVNSHDKIVHQAASNNEGRTATEVANDCIILANDLAALLDFAFPLVTK